MNAILQNLIADYPRLAVCAEDMERAFELMREGFARGATALLCGNGGSAADADRWSAELLTRFLRQRSLTDEWRGKLGPELSARLDGALPAIPLTGFPAFSSAYSNDVDPRFVFAQLVWALGREGDIVIALSTSGNSGNVVEALRTASAKGMKTLGLTGRTGGVMASMCDVCLRSPEDETALIQEDHMRMYHALNALVEEALFGEN